jgi:hypothetical protein
MMEVEEKKDLYSALLYSRPTVCVMGTPRSFTVVMRSLEPGVAEDIESSERSHYQH